MVKMGDVYCLSDDEIEKLRSDSLGKFIMFENTWKGDIIDDGYAGFEAKEDIQTAECTACGCQWEVSKAKLQHKKTAVCPCCEREALALNRKLGRRNMRERLNFVVFWVQDYNNVWAECVRLESSDYTDVYCPAFTDYQRRALYHFTPGGGVKYKYSYGADEGYKPMKAKTGYIFYSSMGSCYCNKEYFETVEQNGSNISDTFLKYSCFSAYSGDHYEGYFLRYLMMYCEAPVFCEFFMKVKAYDIIQTKIEGNYTLRNIRYRAKNVKGLFKGLDKPKTKAIIEWLKNDNSPSVKAVEEAIDVITEYGADYFRKLAALFGNHIGTAAEVIKITGQSPVTLSNYLKKQVEGVLLYRDYIRDCVKLGYNLSSSIVLYPKELKQKHGETVRLVMYSTTPEEIKASKKRAKKLKRDGMEYSHKRLCAIVPEDTSDIIREGALMEHCVGGYARSHALGETTIIFIRKRSDIGNPFFTLEIDEKTGEIMQCYGYKNRDSYKKNLEIFQFLEHYQRHIAYCHSKNHRKVRITA